MCELVHQNKKAMDCMDLENQRIQRLGGKVMVSVRGQETETQKISIICPSPYNYLEVKPRLTERPQFPVQFLYL